MDKQQAVMQTNASTSIQQYCSFCGKSQRDVKIMFTETNVYICDECLELCNDILREELKPQGKKRLLGKFFEMCKHGYLERWHKWSFVGITTVVMLCLQVAVLFLLLQLMLIK